jgi:hypothetical protein
MKMHVWLIITNTGNVRQVFKTKAKATKTLKRAGYVIGHTINDYTPFYLINGSNEVSTGYITKMEVY